MASVFFTSEALPEEERNRRIYDGDLIVFRGFSAVADLVRLLRGACEVHLGTDPETVHRRLSEDTLNEAAERLRKAIAGDERVTEQLKTALRSVGVDLESTYGDGLEQRVQMASSASRGRLVRPLGVHRDTWGSNVMAQTNWWGPVWPTTPARTIALFPGSFRRPVENDSADWDFRELVRHLKEDGRDTAYPLLPLATNPPGWDEALPVSIEPGDLLCFSGAHLHASVPNNTDRTRLSFEVRTVNGGDVRNGSGAPNVDSAAMRTTYQLFRGLTHGERLGPLE